MQAERSILIVPTYNERENIERFLECVRSTAPSLDILVVDDDSPDGTADLTQERFKDCAQVNILRRKGVRGLGLSYVDGYLWALMRGYDRVLQMDADFSHDPKYLPQMIAFSAEADVVFGSRYCSGGGVRDWPMRRRMLSRFANMYVSFITGIPVRDATSGFRCYRRGALERIGVEQVVSNGYAFQVEMTFRTHRAGLKIREMPIIFVDRTLGKSKMSSGVIFESVLMPWRLRFGTVGRNLRKASSSDQS